MRMESTSDDGHELVFAVDAELDISDERLTDFQDIYNDFIEYKSVSADFGNLPRPPDHVQMEFLTAVDLFGKDLPNFFPKPIAKREQLHHLHVFDGTNDWSVNRWKQSEQSKRSSDSLLFYSYFEHKNVHYFYILKFIQAPDGHAFQSEENTTGTLSKRAAVYRLQTTGIKS
ncbi:type II toxin-antitoxin system YafO family toxin [Enterobacter hormaechei]|uniref:type II toxin-antitoxin system YafO family toxin n=1 Tax=Enterobacter hormaechei TaxID=158836 RepID=UPI0013F3DDA6|nr:type II toxin-antitoxin system YafO family toxin [Enterobacter hormaechei]